VENPPETAHSRKEIAKKLAKEAADLLKVYRQEGEVHARFASDDLDLKSVSGAPKESDERLLRTVFKDSQPATLLRIVNAMPASFSGGAKKP
jgi:hypothetical protein